MSEKKRQKKILVIPSKEKDFHEKWYEDRDELNFPHPFRMCLTSTPNSGKTNLCKNILIKSKPIFEKIYLFHYDVDCEEYDDCDVKKLKKIPNPKNKMFQKGVKSLIIIEDCKIVNKSELANLDRLFGYTSTHLGLSIIYICQEFYIIPAVIRRMCNVFAIWKKSSDFESLFYIGRKFGLNKQEFMQIIQQCKSRYDFILFDNSGSPDKIRINGYTPIKEYNDRL
jgi:hypothetical protein